MKAQNISICIPNRGCDKNCPYCISKMTGYMEANVFLMERNLPKVKKIADKMGITTILLTGKGEPLFNDVSRVETINYIETFKEHIVELQTNGFFLSENPKFLDILFSVGLNTLALSVDDPDFIYENRDLIKRAKELGLVVRATFNLTERFIPVLDIEHLIAMCKSDGIDQVTLRQITIPKYLQKTDLALKTALWIEKNIDKRIYETLMKQFGEIKDKYPLLRKLNFGANVYDVKGVAFTCFDYCIQDNNDEEDIRTLIFAEDGHLYDNWNSKASILF